MNSTTGDIWALSTRDDAIVVPVNIGWRLDGSGVLGRGIARDAARRWPWLRKAWGAFCQAQGADTPPVSWRVDSKWCRYLIAFPTKPLDHEKPWLSWRAESSLELIESGLELLNALAHSLTADAESHEKKKPILLVPSLGCGNGGLDEKLVVPFMQKTLVHPAFLHVQQVTTR